MKKLTFLAALFLGAILSVHSQAQTAAKSTVRVEQVSAEIRKITFANAPINVIVPETIASLNELIKSLSNDEQVKVVIVTSDVPGYFFNHFDLTQFPNFVSQKTREGKPLWVDLITNLTNAPFITIASIKGRTQGGGDELTLAFDLRYASKELAVFEQPEVGIGLFPGGGGTNLLPRFVGWDRALEVFASGDDYTAEQAEKYGWVTRTLPNAELDAFVDKLARRMATFDKTALTTLKQQLNRATAPQEAELQTAYSVFLQSLSWPGVQLRMPIFGGMYRQYGYDKVEKNLGYYVGEGNRQLQKK